MSLDVYLMVEGHEVYADNITHNLGKMAREAGIYEALWRPDEAGLVYGDQLVKPLSDGYLDLVLRREHYEQFNAENGWGMYEHFLPFVSNYINACVMNPQAAIVVSR